MTSYISGSKAGAYTKHAAALRYDPQHHSAPTVVAKGENVLAEEIIALARENMAC